MANSKPNPKQTAKTSTPRSSLKQTTEASNTDVPATQSSLSPANVNVVDWRKLLVEEPKQQEKPFLRGRIWA